MNLPRIRPRHVHRCPAGGFTLIEALITVAIIGVMAAAVISAFSNAAADSRRVIGRQQQAVVQASVTNWVSSRLGGSSTVAQVRNLYNNTGTDPKTSLERLVLVGGYLDEATYADLTDSGNGGTASQIKSDVLAQSSQYLELPAWVNGSYPKVNLKP